MKLSPGHLKRYKEIAKIFWKFGRSDLVKNMGGADGIDSEDLETEGEGKAPPRRAIVRCCGSASSCMGICGVEKGRLQRHQGGGHPLFLSEKFPEQHGLAHQPQP